MTPLALDFLSPGAALVAVAVALPLAALAAGELRARRARARLGLAAPSLARRAAPAAALALVAALVALAATQPTIRTVHEQRVRTDAQAVFVVDTSRSMLAARSADAETRFARARAAAERLRTDLAEIPTGISSFTDRVLPLVFPTDDEQVFDSVLERALAVDSPPPQAREVEATTFSALADLVSGRYFPRAAKRRLAVVFTDGESRPVDADEIARTLHDGHVLGPIFVRTWAADERVRDSQGVVEPGYRPDPTSGERLAELAAATGGRVFASGDTAAAAAEARRLLGAGPVVTRGRQVRSLSLAPYAILATLVPLAFLLWRRNVR